MHSSFPRGDRIECGRLAYQATGGPRPFQLPGDRPHYARDRLFNVHHIKLEVSFNIPEKKVIGTASTTISAITNGLSTVEYDAIELKIKRVRLESGQTLAFEVEDEKLRVRVGKELAAGEKVTTVVEYEATPRRGLYFIGPDEFYPDKPVQIWSQGQDQDSRYWFPCYDFPNQRATSEVIATVPEDFFALSNGRLVEVKHQAKEKTKTYHWKQESPHVSYLITLAAGEYVEIKDQFNGLPVLYYVPPGREEDARRSFANTPDMLKVFTDLIGVPYPWAKYAQITVADFIFGGMENTSATTLTDLTLHDARAHLDFSSDPLVAHELAHQWFGDYLTCRDWSHAWLNEGFATYFEALYMEKHLGTDEFRYEIYRNAEAYLREDMERYRRPIVNRVYSEPIDIFDRHLYEKASVVLHMMRHTLGDKLFFQSLNHYVNKHKGGVVDTEDLRQAVEEVTGRTMEAFFEQWLYKAGHPDFSLGYKWDDDTKVAEVTVFQKQAADSVTSLFQLSADMALTTSSGTTVRHVAIAEKEHRFYIPMDSKPLMVRFDPGNNILKTLELDLPKGMLLYQLKNDDDCIGRLRAAWRLAKFGSADVVAALKDSVMQDSFWGVQAEAARALGSIKTRIAMDSLLQCTSVKHPKARRVVMEALGDFKDEAAADALLKVVEGGDESCLVEAEAGKSLGMTRSSKAFDALQKALGKESFQDIVRSMALDGMAELKDERALPIAKGWTKLGKSPQARTAALGAFTKLSEGKPDTVEFVSDLLRDPMLRVRLRAVDALDTLASDKALPELRALESSELDGRVKRRAREVVARIKEGKTRSEEVRKLRDEVERVQEENKELRSRLDKLEAKVNASVSTPKT